MRASAVAARLRDMRWTWIVLVAAVAVVAMSATRALLGSGVAPSTEHQLAIPEKPRTVTVSSTMPLPSAHERRLSAMLEQGTMPKRPMMAEIGTDTDCTPDARMISRCRNEAHLEDGSTLVLRHPHDMREVPCLAPGERVLLVPATPDTGPSA